MTRREAELGTGPVVMTRLEVRTTKLQFRHLSRTQGVLNFTVEVLYQICPASNLLGSNSKSSICWDIAQNCSSYHFSPVAPSSIP